VLVFFLLERLAGAISAGGAAASVIEVLGSSAASKHAAEPLTVAGLLLLFD